MTTQTFYYGNPISEYGLEHNRVDYATFAKAFDAVSCDFEALNKAADYDFEPVQGDELYYELDGRIYTPEGMEEKKEELEAHLQELEEMEETPDTLEEIASIEKDLDELQDEKYYDIFQWFIVPENALSILEENNEIVYYSDTLNLYVWGVTHYGTSWSYVLTDIKIS